jgi:hypothetical protein
MLEVTNGIKREKKKIIQWLCCWHKRVGKKSVVAICGTPMYIGTMIGKIIKKTWVRYVLNMKEDWDSKYVFCRNISIYIGSNNTTTDLNFGLIAFRSDVYGHTLPLERVGDCIYYVGNGREYCSFFQMFDPHTGWTEQVTLPLSVEKMNIIKNGKKGGVQVLLFGNKIRWCASMSGGEHSIVFSCATKTWNRLPQIDDSNNDITFYFAKRIKHTQFVVICCSEEFGIIWELILDIETMVYVNKTVVNINQCFFLFDTGYYELPSGENFVWTHTKQREKQPITYEGQLPVYQNNWIKPQVMETHFLEEESGNDWIAHNPLTHKAVVLTQELKKEIFTLFHSFGKLRGIEISIEDLGTRTQNQTQGCTCAMI